MKPVGRQNSASQSGLSATSNRVESSHHNLIIQPNQPINDNILNRFIQIQSQTDEYERQGIFEGLKLAEEDFETLEKSKRQAEINHKVLSEQSKKEKQDFDNISQPTVQSFFKSKQAHEQAITKEQVRNTHRRKN